jgi:hypothetical protein
MRSRSRPVAVGRPGGTEAAPHAAGTTQHRGARTGNSPSSALRPGGRAGPGGHQGGELAVAAKFTIVLSG